MSFLPCRSSHPKINLFYWEHTSVQTLQHALVKFDNLLPAKTAYMNVYFAHFFIQNLGFQESFLTDIKCDLKGQNLGKKS